MSRPSAPPPYTEFTSAKIGNIVFPADFLSQNRGTPATSKKTLSLGLKIIYNLISHNNLFNSDLLKSDRKYYNNIEDLLKKIIRVLPENLAKDFIEDCYNKVEDLEENIRRDNQIALGLKENLNVFLGIAQGEQQATEDHLISRNLGLNIPSPNQVVPPYGETIVRGIIKDQEKDVSHHHPSSTTHATGTSHTSGDRSRDFSITDA